MKRRVIQRRVVVLLLLLVAGAIVNIAVAWGLWLWGPAPRYMAKSVANEMTVWRRYMQQTCDFEGRLKWAIEGGGRRMVKVGGKCSCISQLKEILDLSSGWPLIAMNGQYWYFQNGSRQHAEGLLDAHATILRQFVREEREFNIPFRPLMPGFAINTIFYAAILWLLFAAPFTMRRWRRIKRGLCPACAYPWGAGTSPVCTECGKPLKFRKCMGLPPPATPAS